MRPWLYRLLVRVLAFFLRHGRSPEQVMEVVTEHYPEQSSAWRLGLVEDAQARNQARMAGA